MSVMSSKLRNYPSVKEAPPKALVITAPSIIIRRLGLRLRSDAVNASRAGPRHPPPTLSGQQPPLSSSSPPPAIEELAVLLPNLAVLIDLRDGHRRLHLLVTRLATPPSRRSPRRTRSPPPSATQPRRRATARGLFRPFQEYCGEIITCPFAPILPPPGGPSPRETGLGQSFDFIV